MVRRAVSIRASWPPLLLNAGLLNNPDAMSDVGPPGDFGAHGDAEVVIGVGPDGDVVGNFTDDDVRPGSGVFNQAGHLFLAVRREGGATRYGVAVRHRDKLRWPGGLDFTGSGKSRPGEDEKTTALREAFEELRLQFRPEALRLVARWVPSDGYCSRSAVYIADWDEDCPIHYDEGEIEGVRWMTADELYAAAAQDGIPMKDDLRTYVLSRAWPPADF
jgi:8-oxo-dGTP pyrophosphatase MutT (NUDIX family)